MGLFGLFGKKKKEVAEEAEEEPRDVNYPITPASYMPRQQQPTMPTYPGSYPEGDDKEFQVLSSKLDALNAKIDVLNQRLENLERLARQEEKPRW